MSCFPNLLVFLASLGSPRFFPSFHNQTTLILAKTKGLISFRARFEHTTLQLQSQSISNSTNSYFVIISKILGLHYHYSHSFITLKNAQNKDHTIGIHRT